MNSHTYKFHFKGFQDFITKPEVELLNGHLIFMSIDENAIYHKKYLEKVDEFWDLQQVKQTDEEKEYEDLIKKLQEMLVNFKDEILNLEKENEEYQADMNRRSEVREKYEQLQMEQNRLLKIKTDLDYYYRK